MGWRVISFAAQFAVFICTQTLPNVIAINMNNQSIYDTLPLHGPH